MCLLWPFLWLVLVCGYLHDLWHATEAIDVLQPILRKFLIDDAVAARGVVEAMRIGNDANVCQTAEEYQGSKLELLFDWRR